MFAAVFVLLALELSGPGDGRRPVAIAWDSDDPQPHVIWFAETQQGDVLCFRMDEPVVPGQQRCIVWLPPGPNVIRFRGESAALRGTGPCPSGKCVTTPTAPITVPANAGAAPFSYRIRAAGELKP